MNVIDITEVPMGTPNSSQLTQPHDKSFTLLHTASEHHTTSHSITTCIIHNFKFNPSNSSSLVGAMETSYSLLLGGALMLVCVQGNGMGCWLTPLGAFCFFSQLKYELFKAVGSASKIILKMNITYAF